MKKKFGTVLDEELILRAKKIAPMEQQALSQLLENALRMYLDSVETRKNFGSSGVSQRTRGAMKISTEDLKAIMEMDRKY